MEDFRNSLPRRQVTPEKSLFPKQKLTFLKMDFSSSFDWNAFSSSLALPLSPQIQSHLLKVYSQLAQMLMISSLACYFQIYHNSFILQTLSSWSFIGALGCLLAFHFTDELATPTRSKSLLYGFALFKGLALGPIIEISVGINPTILVTALVSTSLLFGSLSLAVWFSPRPSQIYVTGLLASALSITFWLSIVNWFLKSSVLFEIELWLGLGLFAMYVVYDTQMIIQKCQQGQKQVLKHAMELYIDFVSLFVRIMVLLMKKEERKERKKRN
jgi:Bax inhibitor 1